MLTGLLIKKGIITVVPVENTFFIRVDIAADVKLSYESILFNYHSLSPYKNSSVSYIQSDGKLFLWFYETRYKGIFTVPEGALYYFYFLEKQNIAYISKFIAIEDKIVFVIDEHGLVYQSSCSEQLCEDRTLLLKKYHVVNVIEKSATWHKDNRKKIVNSPLYVLIRYFLDKSQLIHKAKEILTKSIIPLVSLLMVMLLLQFGVKFYLEKELATVTEKRENSKYAIKELFKMIRKNKSDIRILQKYMKKYENFNISFLIDIAKILDKAHAKAYYYTQNKSVASIRLECNNVEDFLSSLALLKYIDSYKLTRQINKGNLTEVWLDIKFKRVPDGQ